MQLSIIVSMSKLSGFLAALVLEGYGDLPNLIIIKNFQLNFFLYIQWKKNKKSNMWELELILFKSF